MKNKIRRQNAAAVFPLAARTRNSMAMIAGIALEEFPTNCCDSDLGLGRKALFEMPLKMRPVELSDFIWVYTESNLPNEPKDAALGFTEDDVIEAAGIQVFKRVQGRFYGQTFGLETLFSEISDLSLRNRIICRVAEMKASIRLDDEFIERANLDKDPVPYFH